MALALARMRRRGFELAELTEKLHDKGIEISAPTLSRYPNAWRRQKAKRQAPALLNGQGIAICLFLLVISLVPLLAEYGRADYTGKP